MRFTVPVVLASSFLCYSGAPAHAHHSFSMFDATREVSVAGTVQEFQWTNPHTWIWLSVKSRAGDVETWAVEGASPNNLVRDGWHKDAFETGDKVTLIIHPFRGGRKGGSLIKAILSDGHVLRMSGSAVASDRAGTPAEHR
jgi:hypothetical protein